MEERLRIVEAAAAPGVVVADVARQFDVCNSLIYMWQWEARGERPAGFMPVTRQGDPAADVPRGPEPAAGRARRLRAGGGRGARARRPTHLELEIAKLKRDRLGLRSERTQRRAATGRAESLRHRRRARR